MSDFTDLQLQVGYRSDGDASIIRDFYVPCLQRATLYQRAVGYFTSSSLSLAAQGVAHLLKNEGRIQLVASPALSDEDIDAIRKGYRRRETVLRDLVSGVFKNIESQLISDRLNCLAWLIERRLLDVRLAIPVNKDGSIRRGIYHEKIGLFIDSTGNGVAFSGSSNETAGGLVDNFESIDVFWSWEDPQGRVRKKRSDFERLWNNSTPNLEVIPFTDVTREILQRYRRETPPLLDPLEDTTGSDAGAAGSFGLPRTIQLRDYQQDAINNWLSNRGRGTFKMATGSGKTITALAAAARLFSHGRLDALVVVCPYRHLVSQWGRECQKFGADPILAFESRAKWADDLSQRLFVANRGVKSDLLVVVTTTSTFASEAFQSRVRYLPKNSLIVGDEAHNMGAAQLRQKLPENIPLRLALSATPERWFDDSGTAALFDYFGPVLKPEFTLADALKQGALVPYRYHPILVPLTDDEMVVYLELSEKIAKAMFTESEDDNPALTALLAKRARLIGLAANKLPALRDLMSTRLATSHTLVYCGDGSVESDASDSDMERHVDAVARLLGSDLGFRVATYTAETPLCEREDLRERIDSGDLQGLVAIRCLDEGVDIPSIRTAVILASSKNPRQFIQRRGRVLRPHPGKESADIFDMIVLPPSQSMDVKHERKLFRSELLRFIEFADLALNAGEARAAVLDLQRKYHLMDI